MQAGSVLCGDTIDLHGFRGTVTATAGSSRNGVLELRFAGLPYPVLVPADADVVLVAAEIAAWHVRCIVCRQPQEVPRWESQGTVAAVLCDACDERITAQLRADGYEAYTVAELAARRGGSRRITAGVDR
jgi:hypothetical protein